MFFWKSLFDKKDDYNDELTTFSSFIIYPKFRLYKYDDFENIDMLYNYRITENLTQQDSMKKNDGIW